MERRTIISVAGHWSVKMVSERSSRESSNKTRSGRSNEISEDNPASETESIVMESSDSQRPKKCHSEMWDYFTKNTGRKKVLCQLCSNEYSYLGTTSNLRDHLIHYHKDKYKRKDIIQSGNKQQTSMDIFVNHFKCPPARAKKITELVAFMVAKDLRPAAIVDGEGFK